MNLSDRLFNRLVLAALAIGFAALIAAGAAALWSVTRNLEYARLVGHTREVEEQIGRVQILMERAETARRGFLLEQDARFDQVYRGSSAALPPVLARLAALTVDNPAQAERVAALTRQSAAHQQSLERSMALARRGAAASARADFAQEADELRRMRDLANLMLSEEERLLQQRDLSQRSGVDRLIAILGSAAVLLVLVAAGSFWVIRRYTRDLNRSRDRLRLLNDDLEGAVAERTIDLKRANEEIQRFAYIVSHDLRSPLVNVMGFTAELDAAARTLAGLIDRVEAQAPALATPEARVAVRDDLPEAIGFIRSSTQKMDRLINAILQLSREGRRTLRPAPIEMNEMVGSIIDSLRHRSDQLGATIEIDGQLPAIVSDRLAIEQILSNLIENAIKYLKPGRPGLVRVAGARQDSRIVFSVIDNGRGIEARDHDRIFDLFRRAGTQDQPGEGIGLAHVRALAHRLGGTIACQSELDEGATFRLSLPITYREGEGMAE